MPFKVKITPRADRASIIKKSCAASDKTEDFYAFRNEKTALRVVRLELGLPIYRMDNSRTFSAQREHVVKNKLPHDYFIQGQEKQTVQQEQHDLLFGLAKRGKSGSVTPVYDVLKAEGQREPLLITSTGVVINGNRRLAAMRELHSENETGEPPFEHVDFMVLPEDAGPKDIIDIEAFLQGRPETRLDYDWIGDAELINRLIEAGRTIKQIANRLNRTEADIKNSMQALVEADIYLRDWAGAEGEYSRIRDDAEQLFKDLPKLLSGKDTGLVNASRAIGWTLLENRDRLSGRLYNFNQAIGGLADDVIERFSKDLDIQVEDYSVSDDGEADNFEIDFDGTDGASNYDAIVEVLRAEENKDDTVDALIDACESAIETAKGQKSASAALKSVSQAHSKLAAIDLSKASQSTYSGIRKQLQAIDTLVKKHLSTLDKLEED
ncbi:MAG: hypothetical protein RIB45_06090 [Marivibrio sp.]|uniref:hypothetical protein n=1 Tax=Marivibrio sp. TaxID=2039719 RepID=UPI0032EAA834